MRTLLRFTILSAALVLAVALGTPNASALCGSDVAIGNYPSAGPCGPYYCRVQSPGLGQFQGVFWQLGGGSPTIAVGVDSGAYTADGAGGFQPWLSLTDPGNYVMSFGTDQGPSDGCPVAGQKLILAITDVDATGHTLIGFASADIKTSPGPGGEPPIDTGEGGNFTLAPIPKAGIVNSDSTPGGGATTVGVGFNAALPAAAYSNGGDVQLSSIITGWNIYVKQQPRADGAPTDRNIVSGGWVQAGSAPAGTGVANFSCAGTNNAFVAVAPVFEGGFVSPRVGQNSTRIECDGNLAEPGKKFKMIDRRPDAVERGTRGER